MIEENYSEYKIVGRDSDVSVFTYEERGTMYNDY
jgi:hypothetical protein